MPPILCPTPYRLSLHTLQFGPCPDQPHLSLCLCFAALYIVVNPVPLLILCLSVRLPFFCPFLLCLYPLDTPVLASPPSLTVPTLAHLETTSVCFLDVFSGMPLSAATDWTTCCPYF
eukprot:3654463-Amphidinium_carterae.2